MAEPNRRQPPWGSLLWERVLNFMIDFDITDGLDLDTLKTLVQVSTVSRGLCSAAASLLKSDDQLILQLDCPYEYDPDRICLSSKLLQSWAPYFCSLRALEDSWRIPGLSAFMAAGSKLRRLQIACCSVLTAARAGSVLAGCSKEGLNVEVVGTHTPHAWPPHMCSLGVRYQTIAREKNSDDEDEEDEEEVEEDDISPWEPLQPCALLHTLAHTQGRLKELGLQFDGDIEDIQLVSPGGSLPVLSVCRLEFTLAEDTVVDLGWLQRQPCDGLRVDLTLRTDTATQHLHVTDQLLRLPVHSLYPA